MTVFTIYLLSHAMRLLVFSPRFRSVGLMFTKEELMEVLSFSCILWKDVLRDLYYPKN